MSVATVNIVLSDEGWILHTLARHLQQNIPHVTYDLDVNPSADIQYYMTYGTWRYRVSPREIGYFAHIEQDKATQQRFYNVADNMDWAVCHSRPYEAVLREHGLANVSTIPPGVDLERFAPRLKIGVVGRTYHTGRKGERLVAAVMDTPGIEWHFTGVGWPGPALMLSDDQMPDFYRSMDYILVPSLYEGGPMSVIEALACGCQVIAPPVGWVPEYPHIEYRTGDADDLRRVLTEVVAERHKLRQSVLDRGWSTWIDGHHRLFERLGATIERPHALQVRLPDEARARLGIRKPGLIVHGTESGTDKGGPSVRAPRTALKLTQFGYEAQLLDGTMFDQREHDLYHVYNVWHPRTCRQAIEHVRLSGAPVVLSTIYLDLSEKRVFDSAIPKLFNRSFGRAMINNEYARLRELKARQLARGGGRPHEPYEGFHDDVCNLAALADHLICLSEDERQKLAAIGADVSHSTIVANPVEPGLYAGAAPELFEQTYGVRDYVLCVGRLEARKNQITLLHALRESGMPVVLVGHATNPDYDKLLRSVAGPNATFVGRIPANSQMLASAYAGARVFCLPSWSEGAPLVALEAAAAGCNMVLSDRSSEREYFAEHARYCDPCNPEQMLQTITEAYESPFNAAQRAELAGWTATNYGWREHIRKTSEVYEAVFAARRDRPASTPPKVYVDLTSSAHRSGPPSGIARVEERYALELHELLPGRIVFVLWNSDRRTFIEVTHDQFVRGKHKQLPSSQAPSYLFDDMDFSPAGRIAFERNSILLVLGGAWIRNENYVHSLAATKRLKGLLLVAFIHDVIQAKFKQWFPDRVGEEFTSNCRGLIEVADHLIANSACTLNDLREFCQAEKLVTPPIDTVRFGDEIDKRTHESEEEEPQFDRLLPILRGNPFILCVSAIDIRKNHLMLHNLWERMLAEHGGKTPNLIMVGSKGWNIDHFLALVEKNPRISNSFHILNGINDATLDWLYRNCLFTLYPSLYEGWGLPVAEALNYGKVCVAARAGSVPEIAPEMTDLIDPLDFVSWYRVVTGYVLNPALLAKREAQIRAAYKPVSWRASAAQLRDLLLQVSGQRRSLPSVQLNRPVLLDETSAKTQPVQGFKISGWYGAEKTGSWTAGQSSTFQCELLGAAGEVLLLELCGNAFATDAIPSQEAGVTINGQTVGTLCWTGTLLHDLMIVPAAQVAALRAARELNLVFTLPQPMSPASFNPESTDKRLLGIKLASLCFRSLPCLTPDQWTELREPGKDAEAALLVCHGSHRGRSLKLPLLVRSGDLPSDADESVVVGLRLVVKSAADVELMLSADGDAGRQSTLKPGKIETRFVVMTREALRRGTILELSCPRANIADLSVVEYGVFSDLEELALLPIRPGNVLDCTQGAVMADAAPVEGSAASWNLAPAQSLPRAAVQTAFMTGWSRFERDGVWSVGTRAWLGLQVHSASEQPLILAFRLRPYRLKHVDVTVNGRPAIRWNFRNLEQRTQFLPIDLAELAGRRAIIELGLDGAASPASVEGKEDDRLLGVILASAALLDLAAAAQQGNGDKSAIAANTVASFGAADWPPDFADWREAEVQLLPRSQVEPLLLAGWSTLERAGVWSDGDAAFLLLRLKPGDVLPGQELVLALAFRAFAAEAVQIRAGAGEWTVWPASKHVQRRHLTLTSEQLAGGIVLVELRPLGVATPAQDGASPDERRLGVFLTAIALLHPATLGRLERLRLASAQPGPLTLDLAQQVLDSRFTLENWYPPEVHGRWTSQKPAAIMVDGHQYGEALDLLIIARTLDLELPQPQDVSLLVNGVACGQRRLLPSVFQQTSWSIPSEVVMSGPVLRLEFRCSFVAKPSELGRSPDHRPLGILVRSVGLRPGSMADPAAFKLPGDRLCGPAKSAKLREAAGA